MSSQRLLPNYLQQKQVAVIIVLHKAKQHILQGPTKAEKANIEIYN